MNVVVVEENGRTVAEVKGRVDTTTAPEFQKLIVGVLAKKPEQLVLDCSDLEYISSAGLRVLLIIVKTAKADGVRVSLCSLTDFVSDVLSTSGFDAFFEIVKDRNS